MEFTQILGTRIMGKLLQESKNMVREIIYIYMEKKIIVDFLAYSSNTPPQAGAKIFCIPILSKII